MSPSPITIVCLTLAIVAGPVRSTFTSLDGFPFPVITLGSTASTSSTTGGTAAAGSSLAITGLSAASATLAGLGGLLLAVKAGGLLGLAAAAATRGAANRRRGKRSVATEEEIGQQFIFDSVAAMDKFDCGKRYICEVAATPAHLLQQEELTSLLLFQTSGSSVGRGKAEFDEAVRLGALTSSHLACQQRYSACPNTQMLGEFNDL